MFKTEEWDFFNYELPEHRIASRPVWHDHPERGGSKLLHFLNDNKKTRIEDKIFTDILDLLDPGDLLILNNTKVINARFIFDLNGKSSELLMCRQADSESWFCLSRPMKNFKIGLKCQISESLFIEVMGYSEDSRYLKVKIFEKDKNSEALNIASLDLIHQEGYVPIPPYIRSGKSDQKDKEDYQTVYAKDFGSVAAPTAGLHFSKELLRALEDKGVLISYLTLHVGPASFLPVNNPLEHRPMTESYYVSKGLWDRVGKTRELGRRVVAVGTTTIRALESFSRINSSSISSKEDSFDKALETDLFITPGYKFNIVSSCITNFHQPKSTHLLLIAALIGVENLEHVYKHALEHEYRFLSYGDSSFLDLARSKPGDDAQEARGKCRHLL